jgi:DNA-binding NtrC family response regulator
MGAYVDPPRQAARVFVLEDDPEFRRVLVELLEGEGFDVSTCDSYASLEEVTRTFPRAIVLADFWGTSHVELSSAERDQIRDLGRDRPTILLTGRTWAATARPEELNLVGILFKPPLLDDVVDHVRRCLTLIAQAD